jgi:TldD protein
MARKGDRSEATRKKDAGTEEVSDIPQEEYAALKEDFAQIIDRGIRGFQEKTPGRQIEHITVRLQGRYGLIVQTNKRGLLEVPEMSGIEVDNQGNARKQRMIMGMNCSTSTKKTVFGAVNMLRPGETTVKEFEANAGAHELLKFTVEKAQEKGEAHQRKIDEEETEYWPRFSGPTGQTLSSNWDTEGPPSIDQIFELITLAKQTLKLELGAKLADCRIVFFHIVDTMEISDSNNTKIDVAVPRTGLAIQAITDKGNEAYDKIRGTGGMSVLTRHDKSKQPKEVAEELAKRVAKYCKDLDRAQPCSVLGDEAYVLLDGLVSGTLAHEVYGHTSECDFIIANKHDKDVELSLKARLGGQVSENDAFNIIDDGNREIKLGEKEITHCYGAIIVDENGSPPKRTNLVTNGIQTLVMNSPNTFNEVIDSLPENIKQGLKEHGLSGNLRNEKYDKRPLVRMTNTFILPNESGPDTVEKMAAMVPKSKKGVYVVTCLGGWVEPDSGQFEITGHLGYLIENGIITDKPVKDVAVHGHIAKFGNKIKAIGSSKTLEISTGYCGKAGSWVPVEDGGPAILIEDAPVGEEKPIWFWKESYDDYRRQMLEVSCGRRKKSEVYLKFVDEVVDTETKKHSSVCMLNNQLSVEDEVELLCGSSGDTSGYILGIDGKLEERSNGLSESMHR